MSMRPVPCPQFRGNSSIDPNAHIAESSRGCAMPGANGLHRRSFSTVWRSPYLPVFFVGNGVTAHPELRRNAGVCAIFQQASALSIPDFVAELGPELKVVS